MSFPVVPANSLPWLTVEQMAEADRLAIEEFGIELLQMMEHAGALLAEVVLALAPPGPITVLAGGGNAGAEALVYDGTGRHAAIAAAEALSERGSHITLAAIDGSLCQEMSYAERAIWTRRHYELGLATAFDRRLERIERDDPRGDG